ncbi:MAG: transposase ISLbp1 [Stygiobacter sp.]|nr:MAG: transposase ISLbp1 [Stygiobacter sp.]
MLFQINIATKSLSVELTRFFHRIENNTEARSFSKQSYSEARMKMKHGAYIELTDDLVKAYYAEGDELRYKGYRLVAIDGSRIQLPNTKEVITEFGIAENKGKSVPMAMTSTAYDVLNHIAVNTSLERYETSERTLAEYHIEKMQTLRANSKDILLMDRGYPSVYLCAKMLVNSYDFVVRCNAEKFLNEVKAFSQSTATDEIIELDLHTGSRKYNKILQELVQKHSLATIRLRIVKILLEGGTTEYLLTSLLDQETFSVDDLKKIYHLRWNEETYFNFQKNVLEIENFSGKTPETIRQDYFARVLSSNLGSLLIEEAQEEVDAETMHSDDRQYQRYNINRTVATGILKDEVIEMLFAPKELLRKKHNLLLAKIKKHIIPEIPGRTFVRKDRIQNKAFLKRRKAL